MIRKNFFSLRGKYINLYLLSAFLILVYLLAACSKQENILAVAEHFPAPPVPADNPLTLAKVELGRHLFYDKNLSINKTTSCATCHQQKFAFTDGKAQAEGALGDLHPRSSMSLANIAYAKSLNWADPFTEKLEHQLLVPLFAEEPLEMGMAGQEQVIIDYLKAKKPYKKLFKRAFSGEKISILNLANALANFQRVLISANSAYDQYLLGNNEAMSASALKGMNLFFSEKVECFHCHGGFNFSDSTKHANEGSVVKEFHNTGLYNLDALGAYPASNTGVHEITKKPEDMGKFKAPTLRNIALTAPYMHDGSIESLEKVLQHYADGGRHLETGEYAGDGSKNPLKNELIKGFDLSQSEQKDLVEFLNSLTDEEFIRKKAFSDPWQEK